MSRQRFFKLKSHVLMPDTYQQLARFNSERARGILHTPEWVTAMKFQQEAFDAWQESLEPDANVIGREEVF